MLKKLSITLILFLTILSFGCREAQQTAYSKETLICLNELFASQEKGAEATIAVTEKYKDRFTFAHSLQEKISDKYCIEQIESLANSGNFKEAQKILNKQIVQRGYTTVLSQSSEILKAASIINRYKGSVKSLSLTESSREFSRLINSTAKLKKNIKFRKWLNSQKKYITRKATLEKRTLGESFEQSLQASALNNPELLEIILLQKAIYDKTILVPGLNIDVNATLHNQLLKSGSEAIISKDLSIQENAPKINRMPATVVDLYNNVNHYATKGKTVETINALQQITALIEVDKNFRKSSLKQLLNAKGWNNASMINEKVLDISYLLETFYLAND